MVYTSRYYDPEVGRWINADSQLNNNSLLGYNQFSYCNNNFVNLVDSLGTSSDLAVQAWTASMWWLTLIDGVLPIGDIIYWGAIGLMSTAAISVVVSDYTSDSDIPSQNSPVSEKEDNPSVPLPKVKYPGNDPTKAPEGTEWRGKGTPEDGKGNYYNPETGESWHPDLKHPGPIGPHWDYNYKNSGTNGWRVYPNGKVEEKNHRLLMILMLLLKYLIEENK